MLPQIGTKSVAALHVGMLPLATESSTNSSKSQAICSLKLNTVLMTKHRRKALAPKLPSENGFGQTCSQSFSGSHDDVLPEDRFPAMGCGQEKEQTTQSNSGKIMIANIFYQGRVPILLLLFAGLWKINTLYPHPVIALLLDRAGSLTVMTLHLSYSILMSLYLAGLWLRVSGASILGSDIVWRSLPKAATLESGGLYGAIRHPIHAGSILILISLAPMNSPVSAVIILFLAIPFILFLAHYEDQFLSGQFPEFDRYKTTVPGFIPSRHNLCRLLHPFDEKQKSNISSGIRSEFLNISFLGGFSGFILGGNTQSFWKGFAAGIALTGVCYLYYRKTPSTRNQ